MIKEQSRERVSLNHIFIFDRYYNRMFIKNLMTFSLLFVLIYCFSMMLTDLPSFIRKRSYNEFINVKNILSYYFYMIPDFLNRTLPFSFVFTTSYTLSNFYALRKALILITSGVPVWRISLGSILISIFIAFVLMIFNNTFFPHMYQKKYDLEKKLELKNDNYNFPSLFVKDQNGYIYFGYNYNVSSRKIQNFTVLHQKDQCKSGDSHFYYKQFINLTMEEQKKILQNHSEDKVPTCFAFDIIYKGSELYFDSDKKVWEANNLVEYSFFKDQQKLLDFKEYKTRSMSMLKADPSAFISQLSDFKTMNFLEGVSYINKVRYNTNNESSLWIDLFDNSIMSHLLIVLLVIFVSLMGKISSRKYLLLTSLLTSMMVTFFSIIIINIGYSLTRKGVVPLFIGIPLGYLIIIFCIYLLFKKQIRL